MKNVLIASIIIVIVLIGSLVVKKDTYKGEMVEREDNRETRMEDKRDEELLVEADLLEQNSSGQDGKVEVKEEEGEIVVDIELSNNGSVAQPAHFHSGTCEQPGPVVYPLISVEDGKSETTLEVDLDTFKNSLPLIVNVHKSAAESNIYIACTLISF